MLFFALKPCISDRVKKLRLKKFFFIKFLKFFCVFFYDFRLAAYQLEEEGEVVEISGR